MTEASRRIKAWKENPVQFVADNFKVSPDAWQLEVLEHLSGQTPNPRRRIGMKACTGPGKSAVLAWAGWHRLTCFAEKGEHPKGAAISGEGRDNLKDNLWSELSKWQHRSEFLMRAFDWNQERICAKDHSETWFCAARSYAKDANSEAIGRSLSGLHSRYPFILLDETGDMPVSVGQKASQIFTGGVVDGLIMAAGNPTSTTGLLYHIAVTEREQWVLITITADPDDPKRTPRVDVEHAREQIKLYGRDNPWIMSTILGLFPPSGFNALLSIDEVETAMRRHLREDAYGFSQKRLGVDVARFGDDRTIIFPRQGLAAFKCAEMRNANGPDVAARVAQAQARWAEKGTTDILTLVDGTGGYGSSVVDSLRQAGFAPLDINFSGKAIDPRFLNKRAEIWWEMAEWVKRGGALPSDPELAKELTAPKYTFVNGKFQLEPKEHIKDRLKFSPDKADALALTFALPDQAAALNIPGYNPNQMKSEYDPFDPARM